MGTQQEFDVKSVREFEIGEATIQWKGQTLKSKIVYFNQSLVYATFLQAEGSSRGGTENDVFIASFTDNPPMNFQEFYEKGKTPHCYSWVLVYDNIRHEPRTGAITGSFKNAYRTVEANSVMTFGDDDSAIISFKADKR